jgi:hypothetical protein
VDAAERRALMMDALTRVDRQAATLRGKIARLQTMLRDAEARRAHLVAHLADLEAGREPSHAGREPSQPPR